MKPLLAATVTDLHALQYPLLGSPKIDGIRCLILGGRPVSRTLKPIPNKFISMMLSGHDELEGCDGELTVGDSFQQSTSGIMSQDGTPEFVFSVFDRVGTAPYCERHYSLQSISHPNVRVLPQVVTPSAEFAQGLWDSFAEIGYEGLMLRCELAPYKYGRSTLREQYLLKCKKWDFEEATIVGFEEKLHNANEAKTNALGHTERSSHQDNLIPMNTLGALVVSHPTFGEFRIGSGFDDFTRKQIWHNQAYYLGKVVLFRYQPIGTKDKPRIPTFRGFQS